MRIAGRPASVVLGFALVAASRGMPDAFERLPADVRGRATVVLTGRFRVGRGPCEFLPDGSRRWALLRGFTPTVVHRGDVQSDYVGVTEPRLLGSGDAPVDGEEYLVALRPSRTSLAALRRQEGSRHSHRALPPEDVLAVVALSGERPPPGN